MIYNVISCLWVSFGNLAGPVVIFGGPVETSGEHLGLSGGIGGPLKILRSLGALGELLGTFSQPVRASGPRRFGRRFAQLFKAFGELLKRLVHEIVREGCVRDVLR